jgi:hypothetical protein
MPFDDERELLLPHGDLELLKKYESKGLARHHLLGEEGEMKRELKRYIPPYKARGGLVHGNA